MKVGNYKRLSEKDFRPEDQELIGKLALIFNNSIETLYLALSNRLSFQDNMQSVLKDITVKIDSNGIPTAKTTIKVDNKTKVQGCVVVSYLNLTNSNNYVNSAPFISWTQTQEGIVVNHITGLKVNEDYSLKILTII